MQNPAVPSNPLPAAIDGDFRHVHECADCGMFSVLPAPVAGTDICCARCGNILRRVHKHSLERSLIWSVAALCFYMLTMVAPMLQVGIYGNYRSGKIETGSFALDNQGYWMLAAVVLLTTILLPFIKIAGTLIVLIAVRLQRMPRWIVDCYVMVKHVRPWVMIEVYLLGFLVAYSRLQLIANVQLAVAVFGLIGLMISIVAMDAVHDPEMVWDCVTPRRALANSLHPHDMIGCDTCDQVSEAGIAADCPRCGDSLHRRKPDSLSRSWALTIAAAILYLPSNAFPIMNITKLGKTQTYTIFGGMMELVHVDLVPLAILVFIASIAIPVFKLMCLVMLMIQTQTGSVRKLRRRTQLYRLLNFIGRWSMVDIFVVSILVALVHFGWLTQITANSGAIYFAAVVVLTLLAVHSFDPRLMWDAAKKSDKAINNSSAPKVSL